MRAPPNEAPGEKETGLSRHGSDREDSPKLRVVVAGHSFGVRVLETAIANIFSSVYWSHSLLDGVGYSTERRHAFVEYYWLWYQTSLLSVLRGIRFLSDSKKSSARSSMNLV